MRGEEGRGSDLDILVDFEEKANCGKKHTT